MGNLSDVPNELLASILQNLDTQDKWVSRDLTAVSRISTQFRRLSEPFLYRNIRLLRQGHRINLLHRTLLNRPELASRIWHFELSGWKLKVAPSLTEDEKELVKKRITATAISPENYGLCRIQKGEIDIGVALVLSMCTNLKSLHLEIDFPPSVETRGGNFPKLARFTSKLLREASIGCSRHISNFESLRTVHCEAERDIRPRYTSQAGLAVYQAVPFFCMPNVQSLTLLRLRKTTSSRWFQEMPCASSLTHLELKETGVATEELEELLLACPNLKSLKYEYLEYDDGHNQSYFYCNQINQSLKHLSETLEIFDLDAQIGEYTSPPYGSRKEPATAGFFQIFQNCDIFKLHSLRWSVRKPGVMDTKLADVLPLILRKLTIKYSLFELELFSWEAEDIHRYLEDYVRAKDEHHSQLEAVEVVMDDTSDHLMWWSAEMVESFKGVCNDVGVVWESSGVVCPRGPSEW